MLSLANTFCDAALALVYPQACAVCNGSVESRHDGVVCSSCWNATPLFDESDTLCWKCGALSQAAVPAFKLQSVFCGRCDDDSFTAARACGNYAGALRAAILELKRQPHLPGRLQQLMHVVQRREPLNGADLIMPVPLHPARERERGFNQALILANEISQLSRLPLDEYSLVRQVQTPMHRAGMDSKSRRQSVATAFAVRHADLIAGQRVLLIDDVFTTGATASACAKILKDAGAAEVFVLTIARA